MESVVTPLGAVLSPYGGYLGVGTTSPAFPLHVAGQCMTGDTLLPIRRRKKKGKGWNY